MKRAWIKVVLVAAVIGVGIAAFLLWDSRKSGRFVIAINQFVQHPQLDDVREGLLEGLKEAGISEDSGASIIIKNANGDQNTAFQINQQFVSQKVSMIIPIATPSAQSACKATKDIPIVFAAITDPVKAGIADSFERPGGNKTGTSDRWPYDKQVGLIREFLPNAKKVGIILNPGETNTEASMAQIRPAMERLGLERVEVPVSNTAEVYAAAMGLVGRCDAILVPADNTVTAAFDSVFKVAKEHKIPVFAGSIELVKKGAIATYGVSYREIGRTTGKLAARILQENLNPGSVPVEVESQADLVINLKGAELLGVAVPEDMEKEAKQLFRDITLD